MKNIAIVDDNEDNCLVFEAFLEDFFTVTIYFDGPTALVGFTKKVPDLILMDISLPGMDGFEVLKHIRRSPSLKNIPVIAITAHSLYGELREAIEKEFDGFISKPVLDQEAFVKNINSHLK